MDSPVIVSTGYPGPPGPRGKPGEGIRVLGIVETEAELPPSAEANGDSYIVGTESDSPLYMWIDGQWHNRGNIVGPPGEEGPPGREIELSTQGGQVVWRYQGDTEWNPLVDISSLQGEAGKSVEIRRQGDHIEWRQEDESWQTLVSLEDLKGDKGDKGDPGDTGPSGPAVELRTTATHAEWREENGTWQTLIALSELTGSDGSDGADGQDGADGNDGLSVELQSTATHIQWRQEGGTWQNLVDIESIRGPKGDDGADGTDGQDGADGKSVEIRIHNGHIEWRVTDGVWEPLVALEDLRGDPGTGINILGSLGSTGELPGSGDAGDAYLISGHLWVWGGSSWEDAGNIQGPPGDDGQDGADGQDGVDGADGKSVELRTEGGYIQWRQEDGVWQNIVSLDSLRGQDGADGSDGTDGVDGKSVELQVESAHIQWRQEGESWQNLIPLSAITGSDGVDGSDGSDGQDGSDGREIELQSISEYIQWRYVGESWQNLVALSELKGEAGETGPPGPGIPEDGTEGDVLVKGEEGPEWVSPTVASGVTYVAVVTQKPGEPLPDRPDAEVVHWYCWDEPPVSSQHPYDQWFEIPELVAPQVPNAITDLSVTVGDESAMLSWTVPESDTPAEGVNLYRNTSDDFASATEIASDISTQATTFEDTGLTNDTEYWWWAVAYNFVGDADPSNVVSGTPQESFAPSAFSAGDWTVEDTESGGEIEVTVSALPSADPSITDIEYRIDGGSAVSAGINEPGYFTVDGLTNDQQVDVEIRAVNSEGEGDWSDVKQVTPTEASVSDALFVDDFDRPGEDLSESPDWEDHESSLVVTGGVVQAGDTTSSSSGRAVQPLNDRQWVEIDVTEAIASGNTQVWVCARMQENPSNYLALRLHLDDEEWAMERRSGGATATIGGVVGSFTLEPPHTMRIEADGDQITGYLDGVELGTMETTTHPSGFGGIRIYIQGSASNVQVSEFRCGNLE